ncbi:MAG: hypothetical protein VCE74_15865 [Alphaproteobacteria bacterium]|jgi:hypothetical protein
MVETKGKSVLSRRQALARLGLAAVVVYAAPTITHIDGAALARRKGRPSVICPGGSCGGGKGRHSRNRHDRRRRGKGKGKG